MKNKIQEALPGLSDLYLKLLSQRDTGIPTQQVTAVIDEFQRLNRLVEHGDLALEIQTAEILPMIHQTPHPTHCGFCGQKLPDEKE